MTGWVLLYAIVWAVGIALRAAERSGAAQQEARFIQWRHELARELHDALSRDIAVIAMQAEALSESDRISSPSVRNCKIRHSIARQTLSACESRIEW